MPSSSVLVRQSLLTDLWAASQLRTIYIPRPTEDVRNPDLPDGPSSVKPKSEGGPVDAVIHSFEELLQFC